MQMANALHWMATDLLDVIRVVPRSRPSGFGSPYERWFAAKVNADHGSGGSDCEVDAERLVGLLQSMSVGTLHGEWPELPYGAVAAYPQEPKGNGCWAEPVPFQACASGWNAVVVRAIHEWVSEAEVIPQRQFWTVVDAVASTSGSGSLYVGDDCWGEAPLFGDVVGQNHWRHSKAVWELSGRKIRVILRRLVGELERLDFSSSHKPTDLHAYFRFFRQSLLSNLLVFVWCRVVEVREDRGAVDSRTHDQVRAFIIHTGVSPPALAVERPAIGRMLPVSREQWRVSDVENRRRKTTRNLRNALRQRRAKTRIRGNAQGDASVGRGSRFTGCWRYGENPAVAGRS